MKKIKFLMLAMMAVIASTAFIACSSDDDDSASNYQKYQQAVNQTVNSQKKNNKVILLVAFGSTWEQAYDTFDQVVADYKSQFTGWDVFLSFSSAICINNARAGENVAPKDYYDPEHWLTAIGLAGYKQIVVQSLQVIPGEEYRRVRDSYVKDFMNNRNSDFTTAYMKSIDKQVAVGTPLMAEESDAQKLAQTLNDEPDVKAAVQQGIVAFMGHGNPVGYDYYGGNVRYLQLESYLRALNPNYYVGTVDMAETYAADVLNHIDGGNFNYSVGAMPVGVNYEKNTSKAAQLFVLMSIAGDHAHNDMADEEDPESWFNMLRAAGFKAHAYETNYPKAEACYSKYQEGNEYIPALAERSAVRKLWMKHTQDAIDAIKNGEGLSTPVTENEE